MSLLLGQLKISLPGGNPGSFISALKKENIVFSRVRYRNGVLSGQISPYDLPYAQLIAERCGSTLQIAKKQGVVFRITPYRKRLGLFLGGVFAVIMLVFLQNFAWEIVVPKEHGLSSELVLQVLEECGLHKGSYLPACNLESIRLHAMGKLPQVSFFTLNRKGSRIEVEFTEAVLKPPLQNDLPCNIVAAKTGTILQAEVYSGQQMVQKGDTVKSGELLVSGIIEGKDGRFYCRPSNAVITALTYFDKEFSVALSGESSEPTGETVFQKYCILFGRRIPLFLKKADTDGALLKTHSEPLRLFGIPLPIQLETEIISYYRQVSVAFSEEEALQLLEKAAASYEQEMLSEAKIVKRTLNARREEEIFTLHIDYQCIEEITQSVPILTEETPVG